MKKIEKNIGKYFDKHRNSNIHSLLDFIAQTYELDILNNSDKGQPNSFDILGDNGYEIISKSIFTLIRMEQENIISYHKQGEIPANFEAILHYNGENINCGKISGDLAQYINTHTTSAIYVNSNISRFANFGFISPELVINQLQAKIDKWALCVSIFSLIVAIASFVTPLITSWFSSKQ